MSSSDVPHDGGDSDETEPVDLPLNVVALEGIGRRDRYGPLLIVILMGSIWPRPDAGRLSSRHSS